MATVAWQLSWVYIYMGKLCRAESTLQEAFASAMQLENQLQIRSILDSMARLAESRCDIVDAIAFCQQAIAISHRIGRNNGSREMDLAHYYLGRDDTVSARKHIIQGQENLAAIGYEHSDVLSLAYLSLLAYKQHDYRMAFQHATHGKELSRRTNLWQLHNNFLGYCGIAAIKLHKLEVATQDLWVYALYSRRSQQVFSMLSAVVLLGDLHTAHDDKNTAKTLFHSVLPVARKIGYRGIEAECLVGLGRLSAVQKPTAANQAWKRAIEACRRASHRINAEECETALRALVALPSEENERI